MSTWGERPLAVTNIVRNMAAMLIMVMSAFATTAGALISNQIGAGEQRFLFKTCGMTLNLTYALLIPLLIILCLFPEPILRIFTDNPSLIAASIPSVYVMATSTLISAPAFILFNAVSGTGNTRAGFVMEMITLAVYTVARLLRRHRAQAGRGSLLVFRTYLRARPHFPDMVVPQERQMARQEGLMATASLRFPENDERDTPCSNGCNKASGPCLLSLCF